MSCTPRTTRQDSLFTMAVIIHRLIRGIVCILLRLIREGGREGETDRQTEVGEAEELGSLLGCCRYPVQLDSFMEFV